MIANCYYCDKELNSRNIKSHVKRCKVMHDNIEAKKKVNNKTREQFIISMVPKYGSKDYCIYISIDKSLTLQDLDSFIRDVWVECCGHLSLFKIDDREFERTKNIRLSDILNVGIKFEYEYDFGSTTELKLEVVDSLTVSQDFSRIEIIARSKEVVHKCEQCGADTRLYDGLNEEWVCESCAEDLDKEYIEEIDYCNSPRDGVCGYCGSKEDETPYLPGNNTKFKNIKVITKNICEIDDSEDFYDYYDDGEDFCDYYDDDSDEYYDDVDYQFHQMMNAAKELYIDAMEKEFNKLERRFAKGVYSFELRKLLQSSTKDELKAIGQNFGLAQCYKYKKNDLIEVLLINYKEDVKRKINLLDKKTFDAFKRFTRNNGENKLENIEDKYSQYMYYFMANGIVFPSLNEKYEPVLLMPKNISNILEEVNEFQVNKTIRDNTKIISLYRGMVTAYGLMKIDTTVSMVKRYLDDTYDDKVLTDILKEASKYNSNYTIEGDFIVSNNIERWPILYSRIVNKSKDEEYKEFSEEELISLGEEKWLKNNKHTKKFINDLISYFDVEDDILNRTIEVLYLDIQERSVDEVIDEFVEMIQEKEIVPTIRNIVNKYITNLPIWVNKGKTINEVNGIVKATSKTTIGRNDLCICGSGKKYKKCCGMHDNVISIR